MPISVPGPPLRRGHFLGGGLAAGHDYNQTLNIAANAEVALLSTASAQLSGTAGLPSLNVAEDAIVYVDGPSIANGGTGLACTGTSVCVPRRHLLSSTP